MTSKIYLRYNYGEEKNFAFEVKFTLCLECTCLDDWMAKIGLNSPILLIGLRFDDTSRV